MTAARLTSTLLASVVAGVLALGAVLWWRRPSGKEGRGMVRSQTAEPAELRMRGDSDDAAKDDVAKDDCSPEMWSVPALDALWAVQGSDAEPLVWQVAALETSLTGSVTAALSKALRTATTSELGTLSAAARIAAQNDLWGLLQRLRRTSAGGAPDLELALEALILHLSPDPQSLAQLAGQDIPGQAQGLLPATDGWREMDTEHAVLSHERAFGLRRVFRLLSRGKAGHALVSQLVALDSQGKAHLTSLVGEIEQLELTDGRVTGAHVWELDRRALRCRGVGESLHKAERVEHIPGLGATSYLLELETPEAVASLPCLRCHDDPEPFSLPMPPRGDSLTDRRTKLLAQASLRISK